ncbi:MAG TPA: hypothetical protein VNZ43_04135 [Sphingomonadaceae bacterium]|jgi:hypothetical protein|nr:hypothetical protein [Sphingomonadaceae bacterium]
MRFRPHRLLALGAFFALVGGLDAASASAYLFWEKPNFSGAPVKGDEPGIGLPLAGATEKEIRASLLWNMRAGLNVAALQCQFSPALMTVANYNDILKHHAVELNDAYQTLSAYFKRTTKGARWQVALDQYTTRTYNGFSTMHAQIGFCDTAASIGREAIARPKGSLYLTAQNRMREFRNSLVPTRDGLFTERPYLAARVLPPFDKKCWDRKNRYRDKKCPLPTAANTGLALR